jgi:hypothetical protein
MDVESPSPSLPLPHSLSSKEGRNSSLLPYLQTFFSLLDGREKKIQQKINISFNTKKSTKNRRPIPTVDLKEEHGILIIKKTSHLVEGLAWAKSVHSREKNNLWYGAPEKGSR